MEVRRTIRRWLKRLDIGDLWAALPRVVRPEDAWLDDRRALERDRKRVTHDIGRSALTAIAMECANEGLAIQEFISKLETFGPDGEVVAKWLRCEARRNDDRRKN